MLLLHRGDGEGPVSTDLDGGVGGDPLIVVVPGEDWWRGAGSGDVQDDIFSFTGFQIVGEVMNDGLMGVYIIIRVQYTISFTFISLQTLV